MISQSSSTWTLYKRITQREDENLTKTQTKKKNARMSKQVNNQQKQPQILQMMDTPSSKRHLKRKT